MSDYLSRLHALSERKKKLLKEEQQLMERRKKEIGELAERFDLLSLSNETWMGLLHEAQEAVIQKDTHKLFTWEAFGATSKSKTHRKASARMSAETSVS